MKYQKPNVELFELQQLRLLAALSVDAGIQEFENDDESFVLQN